MTNKLSKYSLTFILLIVVSAFSANDSATVYNETYYSGLTPLDSARSLSTLVNECEKVLGINAKNLNGTKYGLAVWSLNQKKWYYRKNADLLLTPASTTKLFTTFSLIKQQGKNFNIPTIAYYSGKLDSKGTLDGNLYIKGYGDALFSTSDMEMLADGVKNFGIKRINGNILADPNFFDEITERAQYSGDNEVVQATPPITALNIDRNTATIIVTAGSQAGQAPNIFIMPSSDSHVIINNALIGNVTQIKPNTKKRIKSKHKRAKRSRSSYLYKDAKENLMPDYKNCYGDFSTMMLLSAGAGISVQTKLAPDGKQQFIISGRIKPNSSYSYQHLIYNPSYTIAGAFKNRLKAGGIVINGGIGIKTRDENNDIDQTKIVADFRRPAFDLINTVNKDSDNYLAEILFKMIGAYGGDTKNNSTRSIVITDSTMRKCGIAFDNCKINDGSGLSRRNKIAPETLVNLLDATYNSDFYNEFRNSLSVASIDGTLRKRFKNTLAEANINGKTGTHRNVSSLAGFVRTQSGEDLAFAFVFNGPNVGIYKLLENELGRVLAEFSFKEQFEN